MSRTMTTAEAIQEARRCLNCARPTCRTGCPIENNIPGFIRALSEGNIGMAYEIISERSNLPAICGRVCPHERQCEAHCVLTKKKCGIEIGSLEMFIADFAHNNDLKPTQPSAAYCFSAFRNSVCKRMLFAVKSASCSISVWKSALSSLPV